MGVGDRGREEEGSDWGMGDEKWCRMVAEDKGCGLREWMIAA